jgi:predicted MFS family arabinose efflux permease
MGGDRAAGEPTAKKPPFLRTRLAVLMFLQYAFPGALLQLYSIHLERLGFSSFTIGVCCATQALGTVLVALVAGQAADRWLPAERCLAYCSFLAGVAMLALPELTGIPAVLLVTLAFWLVTGPTLLLGTSICFRHLARPDREFGPVRLWGTVGWAVPAWLLLGWRVLSATPEGPPPCAELFRVGSAFAFVLAVYGLTLPATPPQTDERRKAAPLAALCLLRGGTFAVYCACTFGVCITFPFHSQAMPLLLVRLGVPGGWVGPTLTIAQVSEVIVLVLLPMFLLRLGLRGTMLLGLVAWSAVLTILAFGRPLGLVTASLALNGFLIAGFLVAGQVYVNRRASDSVRASVQALLTFVNATGMLIGNLLVGYVRSIHGGELVQAFAVGAAITGGMVVVFLVGFRSQGA